MSEHMRTRTTREFVEFTVRVPRKLGYPFGLLLRNALAVAGLACWINEEGEEVHTHEENFPDETPAMRLRGLRAKEGITQQELAEALGISQGRLSELESGARPISVAMAKRIGKAYDCNYKSFL